MIVNYNSDNGWTSFLNKISQVPKITTEVKSALLKLPKVNMELITSADELGNVLGFTSDSFYQFAKSADMSGDLLTQYQSYLKSTAKQTTLLSSVTQKAGSFIKNIGASVLSFGANMVASMAISSVITGAISLIDDAIHRTERLIEAGDEARSKISDIDAEYNEKKTFNDEKVERFVTLREGVNWRTNENLSLTNDEYSEYLSLCNQIADIYPTLVTGYDSQKNAILNLGTVAETATSQLNGLLEKQKEASDYQKRQLLDDDVSGTLASIKSINAEIKGAEEAIDYYNNIANLTVSESVNSIRLALQKALDSNSDTLRIQFNMDANDDHLAVLENLLNQSGYYNYGHYEDDGYKFLEIMGVPSMDEMDSIISEWNKQVGEFADETVDGAYRAVEESSNKTDLENKLSEQYNQLLESAITSLETSANFKSMPESIQNLLRDSMNEIDWETAIGGDYDNFNMNDFVDSNVLKPMVNALKNPDVETAFNRIGNLDISKLSYNEYGEELNKQLEIIKNFFYDSGLSSKEYLDFIVDIGLGYRDEDGEVYAKYTDLLNNIQERATITGEDISSLQIHKIPLEQVIELETIINDPEYGGTIADAYQSIVVESEKAQNAIDSIEPITFSSLLADDSDEGISKKVDKFQSDVSTIQEALDTLQSGEEIDLLDLYQDFPELVGQVDNLDQALTKLKENSLNDTLNSIFDKTQEQGAKLSDASPFIEALFSNTDLTGVDLANVKNQLLSHLLSTSNDAVERKIAQDFVNDLFNNIEIPESSIAKLQESTSSIISQISTVKSALSAQSTGGSIDLDFNSEELADYQSALEYVNGTLQLNAEKVKELTEAKVEEEIATNDATKAQKQSEYLQNAKEIDTLRQKIEDNNFATGESAASIQNQIDSLLASNDAIVSQCGQIDLLNASLRESIGTYQAWKDAQNVSESGDMFDDTLTAIKMIDEVLNDTESDMYGRIGREDYKSSLGLIIPDSVNKQDENAINNYLDSIDNLFTHEEGKRTGLNIEEFCQQAVDKGLMVFDEASDEYSIAGAKTMEDFAEGLNLSMPLVQAMFGEMQEFGGVFDWSDEEIKTVGDLSIEAGQAAKSLRGIKGNENLKIDLDISDLNTKEEKISTLDATIKEMNGLKAKPGIDTSEIDNANTIIQYCVAQKQLLTEPAVMSVDTSLVQGKIGEAVTLLQQFQIAQNQLQMQASIGMDTTDAQANVDALVQQIQSIDPNVSATLNIDATSADTINASLAALSPEMMVKAGIDESATKVIYEADTSGLPTTLTPLRREVQYYKTGSEGGNPSSVNGTAKVRGSVAGRAMANGDWGTKTSGMTLVGELGRELLVDSRTGTWRTIGDNGAEFEYIPAGSIVFNHSQTEELLSKGFTASRAMSLVNGTALASGTAMVTGGIGSKKAKKSTTKSTSSKKSSSSSSKSNSTSGSTSKGKNNSSSKSTSKDKEKIDWIEVAIARIEEAIARFKLAAENVYDTFSKRNAALDKEVTKVSDEIKIQQQGYDRYIQEANSVGLKDSLKKKVQNGDIDIKQYDDKTAEKIRNYQEWYEKAVACKDAVQELNITLAELYNSKFEYVITKWDNALQNFQHTAERTEERISRRTDYFTNDAVSMESANSTYKANISDYQSLIKNSQTQLESRQSELTELYRLLNEADQHNIDKNSEGYMEMLADIQEVENEIDSLNASIIENSNNISEQYTNIFENIASEFDNKLSLSKHLTDSYSNALDKAEAQGYIASKKYYEMLRSVEESNISLLQNKYKDLQNSLSEAMASGEIQSGSQAWYDMVQEINGVSEALQEAEKNVVDFNNSIRELQWERFEFLQDRISKVKDEAEFLIDLLGNNELFTDKGQFTSEGSATLGLHGLNYNVLMKQADDYAEELKKINAEIANDPNNTKLIEHRDELLEKQRESILAAEDEKQAIKELVSDGIDKELESLNDLIDKYNDALDSQKDLYDYQERIEEQTKNLTTLQKQMSAYKNDISEETKVKIQKIKVEIEEAKENLEETQYDHYISEQKKLLDDMSLEYEEVLNQRLDNLDQLVTDMIEYSNVNAENINETLVTTASDVGYTLTEQMNNIWNGQNDVLTKYGDDFSSKITTTNEVLNSIKIGVDNLVSEANKQADEAQRKIEEENRKNTSQATSNAGTKASAQAAVNSSSIENVQKIASTPVVQPSPSPTPAQTTQTQETKPATSVKKSTQGDGKIQVGDKVKYVSGKYYNDSYGGSPTGTSNRGQYVYITKINKKGSKPYHISTGKKLGKGDRGWLTKSQISGYAKGTPFVKKDEFARINENGQEIVTLPDGSLIAPLKRGTGVINNPNTEKLLSIAEDYDKLQKMMNQVGHIGTVGYVDQAEKFANLLSSNVVSNNIGDTNMTNKIEITLPNVTNYDEFKRAMKKDQDMERFIQAITVDRIAGKPRNNKYRY